MFLLSTSDEASTQVKHLLIIELYKMNQLRSHFSVTMQYASTSELAESCWAIAQLELNNKVVPAYVMCINTPQCKKYCHDQNAISLCRRYMHSSQNEFHHSSPMFICKFLLLRHLNGAFRRLRLRLNQTL